ncbi:hypothetical protein HDV01_000823 [Terramyces sp. JEL0728]|nr:hypothetical protein HDV01_000823 [Terramyces sp. JEL0728]
MDFKKLKCLENYSSQLVDQIKRELTRKKGEKVYKETLEGLKSALGLRPTKRHLDYIMAIAIMALNSTPRDKKKRETMEIEKLALNFLCKLIDIQALFRIPYVANETLNQVVSVYFIRALQITHGLGYSSQLDIIDLVYQPDGLDCWTMQSKTRSQNSENLFKVFYKLSGSATGKHLPDLGNTYVEFTSCCLKYYLQVEKFEPEIVDKMLHQLTHKISHIENQLDIQIQVYNILVSPLKLAKFNTGRISCIGWLTATLNFAIANQFDMQIILDFIKEITKSKLVTELLAALTHLKPNMIESVYDLNFSSTTDHCRVSKLEALLINMVVSCVIRCTQSPIEEIFQQYLGNKAQCIPQVAHIMALLKRVIDLTQKSNILEVQESEMMLCNVYITMSQLLVITGNNYSHIVALFKQIQMYYPKSSYLAKRTESLSYNIAVFMFNSKRMAGALEFIAYSLKLSKSLQKDKDSILERNILHLQCLTAVGKYSECMDTAKEIMLSNNLDEMKYLESLLSIYTLASMKSNGNNHEFIYPRLKLPQKQLKFVIDCEYKFIYLYGKKHPTDQLQLEFLELLMEKEMLEGKDLLRYNLKYLQLCRKMGKSHLLEMCERLVAEITAIDPKDNSISSILAMAKCELAISLSEINKFNQDHLKAAFEIWSKLLQDIPAVKTCMFHLKIDYGKFPSPFEDLEELQDYLGALKLYIALSLAYMDLGYSGKAGLSLTTAKSFFEHSDSEGKNMFHLYYCYYLHSIGSLEKCAEYRLNSKFLEDDSFVTGNIVALLVDFQLAFASSKSDEAYQLAIKTYRDLSKHLRRSESDSKILKYIFDSLVNIYIILVYQGVPLAAEYYLKMGISLAEKFHSNYYFVKFSTLLSELYCIQDKLDESVDLISQAKGVNLKLSDLATLDAAVSIVRGDIYSKEKSNCNQAESAYMEAIAQVESIIAPNSHLLPPEVDEQELVRYFKVENAKKKDLSMFSELFSKYITLESLKAKILCKSAKLLSAEGNIKHAATHLQMASLLSISKFDKHYYTLSVAKLKMQQFLQKLLKINYLEIFSETVFCIPWNLPTSYHKDVKPANKKIIDQLEQHLNDAFKSCQEFGNQEDTQDVAHNLILLQMIKGYVVQYKFDGTRMCDFLLLLLDPARKNLIVTRATCTSRVLFKLPLTRLATREGGINGDGFDFASAMGELNDIMGLNKATTGNAKNCKTSRDRQEWFQSRKSLDNRLEEYLKKVESTWFAGFKGLISSFTVPEILKRFLVQFQSKLGTLIFNVVSRYLAKSATKHEFDIGLCELILSLGPDAQFEELEDIIYFLLDSYQAEGYLIDYEEVNIDEVSCSNWQIRDDVGDIISKFYIESNLKKVVLDQIMHVVLVPDKNVQCIPWESLPVLRGSPVSRLPSYMMIENLLSESKYLNITNTTFVLNPSGDLKKTQRTFEGLLMSRNWHGHVATHPDKEKLKSELEQSDLFLYFGHGAGESYR